MSDSGASCSRSPSVLITTISQGATPRASRRALTVLACHNASALPRVPMRHVVVIGASRPRGGGVSARAASVGRRILVEREEAPQGGRAGIHRLVIVDGLELFGGREEQLFDHQAGDLVDAGTRVGSEAGEPGREALQFGLTHAFESCAQRHDGRDRGPRSEPAIPGGDFVVHEAARPWRRRPAAGRGSPARCRAGRRCCRGTLPRGRATSGAMSRGTARSTTNIGRPRRAASTRRISAVGQHQIGRARGRDEDVGRPRAPRSVRPTRPPRPCTSAASSSPRSCRRVAMVVLATCSWKCRALSRAISPAPKTMK